MNLSQLLIGQSAKIQGFTDELVSVKLMEMGCVPGEIVKLVKIAPFGDPISISISGYELSLRKKEAATVLVI
jgi:ferrous iron transport protein A